MPLVDELCECSPEFAALWRDHAVESFAGIVKRVHHPVLGLIALEYSSLAIDGRPDLAMVVWNPATARDRQAVQALVLAEDEAPLPEAEAAAGLA